MADDHRDHADAVPMPTWTLFAVPVVVVTFLVSAYWFGVCAATVLTILSVLVVAALDRHERFWAIPVLVLLFAGTVFIVTSAIMEPREAFRRPHCSNNLKQIGIALHNYHDRYRSFPPAYVTDGEGRRMHSWRVLLLPLLEQQELYDRYRFDEPWNGPNNIKLVDEMPLVFQCPSNKIDDEKCMNYLAVIGPQTAWPGDTAVCCGDIIDGTGNTWLVVEVADSGIAWSEPCDLHVQQMSREINPTVGQGISSKHPGGAQVLYADGSVSFISAATSSSRYAFDPDDVHAVLTINGGERVKQP